MKHRKSADEVPSAGEVPSADEELPPLLSAEGMRPFLRALVKRRKLVDPATLREIGRAYEHYDAGLVSRWCSYEDAIAAADAGDIDRLVGLLRAQKPLVGRDRDLFAAYFATMTRRRRWPRRRVDALIRAFAADDYDLLADLVAKRKRGRVINAPAHRAARLARAVLAHRKRGLGKALEQKIDDTVIALARKFEGIESGVRIEEGPVRKLLDNPRRIRP